MEAIQIKGKTVTLNAILCTACIPRCSIFQPQCSISPKRENRALDFSYYNQLMYHIRSYSMEIITLGGIQVSKFHRALGELEVSQRTRLTSCSMKVRDLPPHAIISMEYLLQCINQYVAIILYSTREQIIMMCLGVRS